MKGFLFFVGVCISCVTAVKWIEGDTIIIDADLTNRQQRSVYYEDPIIRTAECKNTRGQAGRCKELNECYPMLFPINKNVTVPQGTLNDGLASILIDIAGFCDVPYEKNVQTFNQVARSEILICCTNPETPEQPAPLPPAVTQSPVVVTPEGAVTLKQRNCGGVKVKVEDESKLNATISLPSKIVGGRQANPGEFPWIVALLDGSRQFCGGSLISNEWIVTAAHCVQHMGAREVANLRVYVGAHNIKVSESNRQVRGGSKVLFHRSFSMQHLHHDVALIKLSAPVTFTDYIQPICIHEGTPSVDGQVGDVAGWGQLQDNGVQPDSLRAASVRIWSNAECQQKYGSQSPAGIGQGMLCSGGDGIDACRGDSGGPLAVGSKTEPRLVGIVSWGIGCGSYPGVYTRASKYTSWIEMAQKRA